MVTLNVRLKSISTRFLTRDIKCFIDKLGKLQLKGKMFAVFDTYLGKGFEKVAKKMENA